LTTGSDIAASDAPGFEEPWQAQVYAMSQVLIEKGHVTPEAWAEALGNAIRERLAAGAADTPSTYFEAVTDAVETVLAVNQAELARLNDAWPAAYEATPHGEPVMLGRSDIAAGGGEDTRSR
jgi:hypothetical protein